MIRKTARLLQYEYKYRMITIYDYYKDNMITAITGLLWYYISYDNYDDNLLSLMCDHWV